MLHNKKILFVIALGLFWGSSVFSSVKEKRYRLWYDSPSPMIEAVCDSTQSIRPDDQVWENSSLPLGNGYMGASVFGRADKERIQLSDKTLHILGTWGMASSTSFADLLIDLGHEDVSCFERGLDLTTANAYVSYIYKGVRFERDYFVNYPSNIMVIRMTASKKGALSMKVSCKIPYLIPFGKNYSTYRFTGGYLSSPTESRFDGNGRTATMKIVDNCLLASGETEYYRMKYQAGVKVLHKGGEIQSFDLKENPYLEVLNADEVVILVSLATNYKLSPSVFENPSSLKTDSLIDPSLLVNQCIEKGVQKGYDLLKEEHLADYTPLYNRVQVDWGGLDKGLPTDRLLADYKKGSKDPYLEELFYQYGRYLLIASSRKGALPPLLQGVWNMYEVAPWNNNYTHNINIQMNYWGVHVANLSELFEPYADYFKAYLPYANKIASQYLLKHRLISPQEALYSNNGWIIGAGAGPMELFPPSGHSGPGTGGFTSKMFWDHFAFTADTVFLKEISYPALEGLSLFFSKTLKDTLGRYLVFPSASPEQFSKTTQKPFTTLGCAFDQQMVFETYSDLIKAANVLGVSSSVVEKAKKQIEQLDPVLIGESGQIKEYREELIYGDLVWEEQHRHLSNLAALYPGTLINNSTPLWIEAAKYVLNRRGDQATGWSKAHKLCLWARTKDGDRSYDLVRSIITGSLFDNLWSKCEAVVPGTRDVFQIDADLGYMAGVCEMLIQSHEDCIEFLPALPSTWINGSFKGLKARGNIVCNLSWKNGKVEKFTLISPFQQKVRVKYNGVIKSVTLSKNHPFEFVL